MHPLNASLKSVNEEQYVSSTQLMTIDEKGGSGPLQEDALLEQGPKKKQSRLKRLKYTKRAEARLESSQPLLSMPKVTLSKQQASGLSPPQTGGSASLERLPESFTQSTLKDSFMAQAQLKTSMGLRKKTLPPGAIKPVMGSADTHPPSSASALAMASKASQGQFMSGHVSAGRTSKLSTDYICGAINPHVYQSSRLSHIEHPAKSVTVMPPLTQRQPQRHSTKAPNDKKSSAIAEESASETHGIVRLSKKKTSTAAVTPTAAPPEFPNFYSAVASQRQNAVLGLSQNMVDPPKQAYSSKQARKAAPKVKRASPTRKATGKRGASALREHDKVKRAPSSQAQTKGAQQQPGLASY